VGGKLEDAIGLEKDLRDSEGAHVFFDVHDLSILAKEDQVDREHHSNGVHAARGNDPEAAPLASPSVGFPEQPNQATQVAVCHGGFRGDKGFPRSVVDVDHTLSVVICNRQFRRLPVDQFRSTTELFDCLAAPTPNDHQQHDDSECCGHDSYQGYAIHAHAPPV
jgi:hypothetical protein